MRARWPTWMLLAMLVAIQWPLWFGKGGWFRVHEIERQLAAQAATNDRLRARNEQLEGEVRDLANGLAAVEERARFELGMIRDGEVFVQVEERPAKPGAAPAAGGR